MNPDASIAHPTTSASADRLVVVSNRLPVSISVDGDHWEAKPSSGGLVTAMQGVTKDSDSLWIGWPGTTVPPEHRAEIDAALADLSLIPVHLTPQEEDRYYRDYCNEVLWPLFHYFMGKMSHEAAAFDTYLRVNERFAETILAAYRPGDRIWIHDFHLMLVPSMLRARQPDIEIGFFLHIPWPSSELFRLLPHREELLRGLLGADYIAFHTTDYALHFRTSCLRVLGLDSDADGIQFQDRRIGIARHPIGIDTGWFREVAQRTATREWVGELRRRYAGRKLVLGVERLDYTKGIPNKLDAFERFLELHPERADGVTLLQLIIPSRLDSADYQGLKDRIEGQVGRINGRFGGPGHTPVEYLHRSVAPEQLVAMYQVADVGLVTPIRDGMNLVAQEFVLCQESGQGMLVLSEFAGAAQILGESLLVNPWDVEGTAHAIATAMDMSASERDIRMDPMIRRVDDLECTKWARGFLRALEETARGNRRMNAVLTDPILEELTAGFRAASRRSLLLDYDGTLRELESRPELAAPTPEILALLQRLAALPDTDVHVVSGRPKSDLEGWFGDLPIHLCAEHGSTFRGVDGEWQNTDDSDLAWMPGVQEMLEEVCREVEGSQVERKQYSLAWHYRLADEEYGSWRARELLTSLEQELSNVGVEVMPGHKVIEVRTAGVHKGSYARRVAEELGPDRFLLCMGDDRTDLDMYRALPPDAVCVHVGCPADGADFTLATPAEVRRVLGTLADPMPKPA